MNTITHKKIVIEFDIWEPFEKQVYEELTELVSLIKSQNKLLPSAGNVKVTLDA